MTNLFCYKYINFIQKISTAKCIKIKLIKHNSCFLVFIINKIFIFIKYIILFNAPEIKFLCVNIKTKHIKNQLNCFLISELLNQLSYYLLNSISSYAVIFSNKIDFTHTIKKLKNTVVVLKLRFNLMDKPKALKTFIKFLSINIIDINLKQFIISCLLSKYYINLNYSCTGFFINKTSFLYKPSINLYFQKFDVYIGIFIKEYNKIFNSRKLFKTFIILKKLLIKSLLSLNTYNSVIFLKNYNSVYPKFKNKKPLSFLNYSLIKNGIHYFRFFEKIQICLTNFNTTFLKHKLEFFIKSSLYFANIKIIKLDVLKIGFYLFGFYVSNGKQIVRVKSNKNWIIKYKIFKHYIPLNRIQYIFKHLGFLNSKKQPLPVLNVIFLYSQDIMNWFHFFFFSFVKYYRIANNYKKGVSYIYFLFRWLIIFTLAKKHKKNFKYILLKYGYYINNKKTFFLLNNFKRVNFYYRLNFIFVKDYILSIIL